MHQLSHNTHTRTAIDKHKHKTHEQNEPTPDFGTFQSHQNHGLARISQNLYHINVTYTLIYKINKVFLTENLSIREDHLIRYGLGQTI